MTPLQNPLHLTVASITIMQTGKVPVERNFELVQQARHLGVEKYHSAGACSLKYADTYPFHEMHEEIVVYWCMDTQH